MSTSVKVAIIGGIATVAAALVTVIGARGPDKDDPVPPPAPTVTSALPTGEASTYADPVTLTVDDVPADQDISVSVVVHEAPPAGRSYWLVLDVKFTKTYQEYYAKRQVPAVIGKVQHLSVPLWSKSPQEIPRIAQVYSVSTAAAAPLRKQLDSPLESTDGLLSPPCADCTVSDPVTVTPR